MNKGQMIEVIAEKTNLQKTVVNQVISEMNEIIIETLKKGDMVKIAGFGTFVSKKRDAKKARNPKTGETVDVPAKMVGKFKLSNEFKEKING